MVVHLHARSSYSLLDSSLSVQRLVKRSKELGFLNVALTDKNVMMGALEFYKTCQKEGVKPIFGLEVDCEWNEARCPLLLIAQNNQGFRNLMKCSSMVSGGKPLSIEDLKQLISGNFVVFYGEGGILEPLLIEEDYDNCKILLEKLREEVPFYLALSYNDAPFWKIRNDHLRKLANEIGIETLALNKIFYEKEEDAGLYKVVQGIKTGKTLQNHSLPLIKGRYIQTELEMKEMYHPEDLEKTNWIAEQCEVEPEIFKTELPRFKTPENIPGRQYLTQLCLVGLKKRLQSESIPSNYAERLKYELEIIINMKFEDYFLIVWDFIRFSRKQGIYVGPGRGSAAGSLVAYCLGITHIDPIKFGLLFERFLNPERISMPDIDVDFPDDRRDEVIQYVYETYGKEHVAHIITFGTLKAKQVLRDVGRVLEVPLHEVNLITKSIPFNPKITLDQAYETTPYFRQLIQKNQKNATLFEIAKKLEGLPRHASTHAAGIVMSKQELSEVVPTIQIEQDIVSTQYTMDYLEDLGLIKMDFLGLRNLTIIDQITKEVQKNDPSFDIHAISLQDEKTFELLRKVNTVGIFQLESDGMKNLLRKMQADQFNDIVATIALFRPGPMENIPLYLEERKNQRKIKYLHPLLEPVLKETYGVMIYQEQIMKVTQIMAGFSLGKADILRKAMSKKQEKTLAAMQSDFIQGCIHNGHSETLAKQLFDLILKFAGYGFNKAHSVSYGLVSYQMAFLKANYPQLFYSALLNSVIGAEGKTAEYVDECRRHGIMILHPSINESEDVFQIVDDKIRFPLLAIKNVGRAVLDAIVEERKNRPFEGFHDFVARMMVKKVNKKIIESLIDAGALDEFGESRKTLMLSLEDAIRYADLVRIENGDQTVIDLGLVSKPIMIEGRQTSTEQSEREKEVLGVYLGNHPILELKKKYAISVESLIMLQNKKGLVEGFCCIQRVKKHRTKKGDLMAFAVGKDETSEMDLVFMPLIYEKIESELIKGNYVHFSGKMDEKGACLVNSIQALDFMEEKEEM